MATATIENPDVRLDHDLKQAAASLGAAEARYLVDAYYLWQEQRKRSDSQLRSLREGEEPSDVIAWASSLATRFEGRIKTLLDSYSDGSPVGRWSKSIVGIGPVIAAGLLAHIDIEKAPTVGHIWRFAGLDPTVTWERGQKRPWNAELKTLCWKAGESFVKVSGRDDDIYGHVYLERKLQECERNERGEFAEQAERKLATTKIGKTTDAYKSYSTGKLPPAHLHARAKRYAVKLFLAHWHHVAFEVRYGEAPPKPYIIEHGGHTHYIAPPLWEGLAVA